MSSASAWDGGRTRHVRAPTLRTLPPPPGLPTVLAVCCGRSSARTRLRGPGNYTPLLYRCHWPEFIRLCRRRLLLRRACPCLVAGKGSAVYGEVTRPAGAGQVQPGGAGVTDEKGSRVLVRLLIACAAPCRCTRLASVKAAKKKKKSSASSRRQRWSASVPARRQNWRNDRVTRLLRAGILQQYCYQGDEVQKNIGGFKF